MTIDYGDPGLVVAELTSTLSLSHVPAVQSVGTWFPHMSGCAARVLRTVTQMDITCGMNIESKVWRFTYEFSVMAPEGDVNVNSGILAELVTSSSHALQSTQLI